MDNATLLIVILLILRLFGGGYYGRGRWWRLPDPSESQVFGRRKVTDAGH
jgi:hypothetical protein